MSDKCMVSIMCTAFNHEEYIRDALEGMLMQKTDFDYEILINDDVSSDRTADIIREYEAKYPDKIRAFYQEKNLYSQKIDVYYAVFFPAARGRYVAFCEGDDYWTDENKLQRQVDFLESHPEYTACVHNTMLYYCGTEPRQEPLVQRDADKDMEFSEILPGMHGAWHTTSLVAKTEILSQRPDYYHIARAYGFADFPFALWLRENGPVRYLNHNMSVYRIDSNHGAWSSGFNHVAKSRIFFLEGVVKMLESFRGHVKDEELLELVDENITSALFLKLNAEGNAAEMLKPRFKKDFNARPLSFRAKIYLNYYLPGLHKLYRKLRGYE